MIKGKTLFRKSNENQNANALYKGIYEDGESLMFKTTNLIIGEKLNDNIVTENIFFDNTEDAIMAYVEHMTLCFASLDDMILLDEYKATKVMTDQELLEKLFVNFYNKKELEKEGTVVAREKLKNLLINEAKTILIKMKITPASILKDKLWFSPYICEGISDEDIKKNSMKKYLEYTRNELI